MNNGRVRLPSSPTSRLHVLCISLKGVVMLCSISGVVPKGSYFAFVREKKFCLI